MPRSVPDARLKGDDGSLIAELALVSPLLVMLLIGIFEFGMGWREVTNNSNATRSAARSVTNVGSGRSADWAGLTAFATNMGRSKNITDQPGRRLQDDLGQR